MASSPFNVVKNNLEGVAYRGDLNNVTKGGIYSVTTSEVTNYPPSIALTATGNLMVINTSAVIHQLFFIGNTIIHMRRYIPGSGWSAWALTTLTPES